MPREFDEQYDESWRYERFIKTIEQRAGISWEKAERAARRHRQARRHDAGAAARPRCARGAYVDEFAERVAGGGSKPPRHVVPTPQGDGLQRRA
jgi:hypothetical protein